MFNEVPNQLDFPAMEKRILAFWQANDVYQKSLDIRSGSKAFVFFEGPPTANGLPHPGHCLTRAIKDLFPRYKTMTGHHVLRKGGWDTHGLPVEVEVCKELGIHTKEEIEAYGVEAFNRKCLESVFRYTKEWEELTRRLGFWVNLDEAYVTYHQSYIESVWWSLKSLFDADLLYQGHKIVWWWAQGGTALSSGEVGQGYREVDDPSVFVRFPLVEDAKARSILGSMGVSPVSPSGGQAARSDGPEAHATRISLLVWTTTPWTLPSNMFAAVHKDFDYAIVHDSETGERLIFAAALVEPISKKAKKTDAWKIERTVKGADLVGLSYRPPFDQYRKSAAKKHVDHAAATDILGDYKPELATGGADFACWRVLHADFVTLESGTGLVHEAPAFGEVDFDLLNQERKRFKNPASLPLLCAVAPNGKFTDEGPEYCRGRWVKECDKDICRDLKDRGLLLLQEQYRHDYPFCWRAEEDPLIQYPRRSWFIRTTQFRDAMLENNAKINWLPEHIKEGRFGNFLRDNVDWSLSRERYWGTPLPIWVCESCGHMEAVDSYDALTAMPDVAGLEVWANAKAKEPSLSEHLKIHKPYIDAVTFACPKCDEGTQASRHEGKQGAEQSREADPSRDRKGAVSAQSGGTSHSQADSSLTVGARIGARMKRVPEVIDCWYDSGAMPFAQWGWPHQNQDMFASQFPADFISEALDQTRGWFYSLVAISTMLFGKGGVASGSMGLRPVETESLEGIASGRGVQSKPITSSLNKRRRILPHWEMGGSTYFLTFRCYTNELSEPERDCVLSACRHWDHQRMTLHAAVVMPDHVHLLVTPQEKSKGEWWSLADLLHSIKSFSAHELNRMRGVTGPVWQQETFDRIVRNEPDFREKWDYIVTNPAKRGLGDSYRWIWVENEFESSVQSNGPEAHATREWPLPFRNCIVLGLLMGEDGLKMSKSKKNYKDPTYIFDHEGADAMRWLFFSGQTPWTSIRFQETAIAEGQREFLIRLYNCYSFFVIYANIDKWTPDQSRDSDPSRDRKGAVSAQTSGPSQSQPDPSLTVGARINASQSATPSELDRWIMSELAQCSIKVFDAMEAYDNYTAARSLSALVDALSNWYIRRSRDRYWKSEMDADKRSAYQTLYDCLVTVSKLIAPFTPFIAEEMYQNLVLAGANQSRDPEPSRDRQGAVSAQTSGPSHSQADPSLTVGARIGPPLSVHLCDYPVTAETREAVAAQIDGKLNEEVELVRQLVSCGRAARAAAKLRVRQPLASVELHHRSADVVRKYEAVIRDELNVKRIEYVDSAAIAQYVTYELKPDFRKIGPKHGALAPKIKGALAGHKDVETLVRQLEQGGACRINVGGQDVELTSDEMLVELHAKEGFAAERIPGYGILVLDTQLTPALLDEGMARDLVNQIQQVRKNLNLRYEQHIDLAVLGDVDIQRVLKTHAETIRGETLADSLRDAPLHDVEPARVEIEGHAVEIYVHHL